MEFIIHCKCLLYVHYTVYPIYMNTMEKFLYCRFDNYLKFNAADYIIEGYQCTKVFFVFSQAVKAWLLLTAPKETFDF